jgi:hypothetical protein
MDKDNEFGPTTWFHSPAGREWYDEDDGRWDDDPSPYAGTYSED